jgi:endoglucanase
MNQRLGRGINLGNSWDSPGTGVHADCGWNNCIKDEDFQIIKAAGFNSVRIPVRWESDVDIANTIDPQRLAGVKEDIQFANSLGMPVIVNFHHHQDMNNAAANVENDPESFQAELQKFVTMWTQVAAALNSIPDDMIVFEIMNEPHDIKKSSTVNEIMTTGYNAIRSVTKDKVIMFEGNGYSKFASIKQMALPQDGNIIFTGHYYDPYEFTHQGTATMYPCGAVLSATDLSQIARDFKQYADSAKAYYPDIDGVHSVPMNMGEFGAIGRSGSKCAAEAPSEAMRAQWTDYVIKAAEKYGISWHYWAFGKTSGFQAYNQTDDEWFPEMKKVFDTYTVKAFPTI